MEKYIKEYKAIGIGFIIVAVVITLLESINFIIIPEGSYIEFSIIFSVWWAITSFTVYKLPVIWRNKRKLYTILSLIVILIIIVYLDEYTEMEGNPLLIAMIILFWIGMLYLLLPNFIMKYKTIILVVYGIVILFFTFIRFGTDYNHEVHGHKVEMIGLLIPAIILLWIYEQWRWLRTLKAEKAKAELELLKSQVNPHFFFNTLNNLYGLAVEKSDKTPEMILKLSDMMRYTIYDGKEDFVNLSAEVSYLENYIELHKIRYQKKVDIVFSHDIDETHKIAPLLLIILLENAFKHGVERLTTNAYIYINLKSELDTITFSVENNFEDNEGNEPAGIGLANLKQRLALIYRDRYEFSTEIKDDVYKANIKISV